MTFAISDFEVTHPVHHGLLNSADRSASDFYVQLTLLHSGGAHFYFADGVLADFPTHLTNTVARVATCSGK